MPRRERPRRAAEGVDEGVPLLLERPRGVMMLGGGGESGGGVVDVLVVLKVWGRISGRGRIVVGRPGLSFIVTVVDGGVGGRVPVGVIGGDNGSWTGLGAGQFGGLSILPVALSPLPLGPLLIPSSARANRFAWLPLSRAMRNV